MIDPASLSDAILTIAYERPTGEADDLTSAALVAEIERRKLDI